MFTASVFKNGANKAIRIPKQLEFNAKEVSIEKDGDRLIITPLYARKTWASLAQTEPASDDFIRAKQPFPHAQRDWE